MWYAVFNDSHAKEDFTSFNSFLQLKYNCEWKVDYSETCLLKKKNL